MATRRTSSAITTAALVVAIGASCAHAAVEIPAGGYLYADHHDELMMTPDGITVEGWFYLDEYPPEGEFLAPLILKPGSYAIFLADRVKFARLVDPGPYVQLDFWDYLGAPVPGRFGCSGYHEGTMWLNPDTNRIPSGEWMHVAFEMRDRDGDILFSKYLNGRRMQGRRWVSFVGESDAPFYIGGVPRPHACSYRPRYASWPGAVDAVRVSRGVRYDRDAFAPEPDLRVDESTIALWRLDGPAAAYEDLSGNGHTLASGGTLPVLPKPKLATTWGALKDR
jgi:hypothetical protein